MAITGTPPLVGLNRTKRKWDAVLMMVRHPGGRTALTAVLAAATLYLGLLGLTDHLVFTVPSQYEMLMLLLDAHAWGVLFLVSGLVLLAGLLVRRVKAFMVNLASGIIGWWGLLAALWQVTTVSPVSWVGPGLALVIAVFGWTLALSWAHEEARHHK